VVANKLSLDLKLLWYRPVSANMILGLDIGGANTKVASSDGSFVESIYLPLWLGAKLDNWLGRFAELNPEAVAVVMTGELADCFENKMTGIISIKTAVEEAFKCPSHFWGVNGFDPQDLRELAGANWSVSANFISRELGDCIFVDMGSTTIDLIPIKERPIASRTDFLRLANGELLYMGLLRTCVGNLLPFARVKGKRVPISPEFFAIAADAYLVLGELSMEEYGCSTPDDAGKDKQSALRRLARCVCADLDEIGEDGAIAIAEQVRDRQLRMLIDAIYRQANKHDLTRIVAAGIGEHLICRAASYLGLDILDLSRIYGHRISNLFPAFAAARQLELHIL
jgi:(4-(4-[2-(gamma-L-glutamylamino)ethyl]phenoxymethyl)furan-2-yl)methanamine synthase